MSKTLGRLETLRDAGDCEETHQRTVCVARTGACVPEQRVGMRRSGALTLSAILMLGGATGGRAQDLSGSVGPASDGGSSTSLGGFALPALPQNWSDSPVKLTASESLAYNSNIFAVPNGFALPSGDAHGDFVSSSLYGASSKAYWYGQQFFVDGSYGLVRYLHQVNFDSNQYSFDAGVNWVLTTRCSGTLEALASKRPTHGLGARSALASTICRSFRLMNLRDARSLTNIQRSEQWGDRTRPIRIPGRTEQFSHAIHNRRDRVCERLERPLGSGDDQGHRLHRSDRDAKYPRTCQHAGRDDLTANYVRHISPNLTLNGQLGATGIANAFSLAVAKSIVPHYLGSIAWTLTPKLSVSGPRRPIDYSSDDYRRQ